MINIRQIAYYPIFGLPLVLYLGVLALLSLLTTATIGYLIRERRVPIPFIWHKRFAALTVIIAVIHGSLALLSYL